MTTRLAAASAARRFQAAASTDVVDALQLVLLVAYLQSDLYSRGLAATGLVPATDTTIFTTLAGHETLHVTRLQALVLTKGSVPIARPTFDFTAKGALPGFAFAPAEYDTFRMLAQAFEDLGVRAHKGQLQALIADEAALNVVLAIHSVEARHAAEIRRLRGKKGWITGKSADDLPAFLQPVYDGEDNVSHGTVNATTGASGFGGVDAATQAFDEPMTAAQVNAVIALFLP